MTVKINLKTDNYNTKHISCNINHANIKQSNFYFEHLWMMDKHFSIGMQYLL
jgi:hypothetical protein